LPKIDFSLNSLLSVSVWNRPQSVAALSGLPFHVPVQIGLLDYWCQMPALPAGHSEQQSLRPLAMRAGELTGIPRGEQKE
jgi:hypothetical protein